MTNQHVSGFIAIIVASVALTPLAMAQDYSIVIGVDGLGSYGLQTADTPFLDSLIEGSFGGGVYNSAFAQHSYVGGQPGTATQQVTSSGPGWASELDLAKEARRQ